MAELAAHLGDDAGDLGEDERPGGLERRHDQDRLGRRDAARERRDEVVGPQRRSLDDGGRQRDPREGADAARCLPPFDGAPEQRDDGVPAAGGGEREGAGGLGRAARDHPQAAA